MSTFAFCNYIRFLLPDGKPTSPVRAYQNFAINESRVYSGITYAYATFGVATGGGTKGGDRGEATLAAAVNAITVNLSAESVKNKWLLEIKTVSLDPLTFRDTALIRTEVFRVARYEMDNEKLLLKLISPLDAAQGQVPNRYLTTRLVGALPSSGTLVVS